MKRQPKEPMLEMMALLEVNQTTWVHARKLSDHATRILAPKKFKRKQFNRGIKITRIQ